MEVDHVDGSWVVLHELLKVNLAIAIKVSRECHGNNLIFSQIETRSL